MRSGSSQPNDAEIKRRQRRILLIIGIVLAALTMAMFGPPVAFCVLLKSRNERLKERLLNEVDHSSLVNAVRQMLEDERFAGPKGIEVLGNDPELPPELRSLEATSVHVEASQTEIEFGGGFHHFGLLILPPDEEPEPRRVHECTQLSDGIWFYEQIE